MTREIAYDYVDVAGVKYRMEGALEFIGAVDAGNTHGIDLEAEPDNFHDQSAIKIIGHWQTRRGQVEGRHIGYVPAVLADLIRHKRMTGLSAELAHHKLVDGTEDVVLQVRIFAPVEVAHA